MQQNMPKWAPLPFHPAEMSGVTRKIQRQMSRTEPNTGDETQTEEDEKPTHPVAKVILCILVFLLSLAIVGIILSPVPMITVGALYLDDCPNSFLTTWLIVGGASTGYLALYGIVVYFSTYDTDENGEEKTGKLVECFTWVTVLDILFILAWYAVGCCYLWVGLDYVDKAHYECWVVYYFVYGLVLGPPVLLGIFIVLGIIVMFFL